MNNNTINLATSAVHSMATTAAFSSDYLESEYIKVPNNSNLTQRDHNRLTEGINSITKSILQQRGVTGSQLDQNDGIPLRPLLLNGSQASARGQSNE